MVHPMRQFIATRSLIVRESRVLVIRESEKYEDGTNEGKYDLPGGRLAQGERFDDSLRREVREETGLSIKIGKPFHVMEWRPVVRGEQWQIVAVFFECSAEGEVRLGKDHDSYKWIDPRNYKSEGVIENLSPMFEAWLKDPSS